MLAAVGSYLHAKHQAGKWLLRIEDLDPPREVLGAADNILRTLDKFGLHWDEEVSYQSQRHHLYAEALAELKQKNKLYPCSCSRKIIKQNGAQPGKIGLVYPGSCRQNKDISSENWKNCSIRLQVNQNNIHFIDQLQGKVTQQLATDIGDVTLKRADSLYAYHLAVVVDDYLQDITHIVRGFDLLDCTPIQIYLQRCLNYTTPDYAHLPIIVNQRNEKLSKQSHASSIENESPSQLLFHILTLLKQHPPSELVDGSKEEVLNWAIQHWNIQACAGHTFLTTSRAKP